jgi:hypothetical protein
VTETQAQRGSMSKKLATGTAPLAPAGSPAVAYIQHSFLHHVLLSHLRVSPGPRVGGKVVVYRYTTHAEWC